MSSSKILLLDNGAFSIHAVYDGKSFPSFQNIAFRIPITSSSSSTSSSALLTAATSTTTLLDNSTTANQQQQQQQQQQQYRWIVGDQCERAPYSLLSRSRGKRPLSTGSILIDAPLQARIWKRLLFSIIRIESETNVDLVVSLSPGTPKESTVLWYTLCFGLFKFKSVTFVVSSWLQFLASSSSFSNKFLLLLAGKRGRENTSKQTTATTTTSKSNVQHHRKQQQKIKEEKNDDDDSNHNTTCFVVDIGFSSISSFAILQGIPRRRGFVRDSLAMYHVGLFFSRLVSFTQLDLMQNDTPDLLIHRGLIENTLQVIPYLCDDGTTKTTTLKKTKKKNYLSSNNAEKSSSCSSSGLNSHLLLWEHCWSKYYFDRIKERQQQQEEESHHHQSVATASADDFETVFFQGSIRRRFKTNPIEISFASSNSSNSSCSKHDENNNNNNNNKISTLFYVLPNGEEEGQENELREFLVGVDGSSASNDNNAAVAVNQNQNQNQKRKTLSTTKTKMLFLPSRQRNSFLNFGHVLTKTELKLKRQGKSLSSSTTRKKAVLGGGKRRKRVDDDDEEEEEDGSEEDDDEEENFFEDSDDDDDDDSDDELGNNNNNNANDDDESFTLRLDHERFIAAELLFNPRAVCGVPISARFAAVFGSSNSNCTLVSALSSTTQVTGNNTNTSSSSLHNQNTIKGGCVSLFLQTKERFAPNAVAELLLNNNNNNSNNNNNNLLLVVGGATNIPGFPERFEDEINAATSSTSSSSSSLLNQENEDENTNKNTFQIEFPCQKNSSSSSSSSSSAPLVRSFQVLSQLFSFQIDKHNNTSDNSVELSLILLMSNYFKKCQVTRNEIEQKIEQLSRRNAHDAAVDLIYDASQNILQ